MNLLALSRSPYFWSLADDAYLFTRHSPIDDTEQRLPAFGHEIELGGILGGGDAGVDDVDTSPTGGGDDAVHFIWMLGIPIPYHHHSGDGVVETPNGGIFGI